MLCYIPCWGMLDACCILFMLQHHLTRDPQSTSCRQYQDASAALTFACRVQALRKVPEVNASWYPDYIRVYHNIDVSVAVQTPGGLMVPVVRDADVLGLAEISATVKELAQKVCFFSCQA